METNYINKKEQAKNSNRAINDSKLNSEGKLFLIEIYLNNYH